MLLLSFLFGVMVGFLICGLLSMDDEELHRRHR
jgi:hypothetical protein